MGIKKRILVAPLNWGLGHATRCIPIIKALIFHGFEPIIASDGSAKILLEKEFPNLTCLNLPAYNISYAKNGRFFKYKLLKDIPKLLKCVKAERKATTEIILKYNIKGIISDNRFGVYSKKIPTVFITHQLHVLSGNTTWFSSKMHQRIFKKFDNCWVPDCANTPNLSGKLGHVNRLKTNIAYIGPLSRFTKIKIPIKYDILVLLSGPEPQRTLLEEKLIKELTPLNKRILFVKGIVESTVKKEIKQGVTYYNFMTSSMLEIAVNESELIISRSGYTTIMDLAKLGKQAFFIPTPGQFEQEYLAKRLNELRLVPYATQDDFTADSLKIVEKFSGLSDFEYELNYKKLFSLFHTE